MGLFTNNINLTEEQWRFLNRIPSDSEMREVAEAMEIEKKERAKKQMKKRIAGKREERKNAERIAELEKRVSELEARLDGK